MWTNLAGIIAKDGAVFNYLAEAVWERESLAKITLAEKKYFSEMMLAISYTGGI